MDGYKQLAVEALQQQGIQGEVLFETNDIRATKHTVGPHGVRDEGTYITVHLPDSVERCDTAAVRRSATRALGWLLRHSDAAGISPLVVGLGNPTRLCDALGCRTLDAMQAERGYKLFAPRTRAQTGLETPDLVRAVAQLSHADMLVAVDTLACTSPQYLCRTIQLSDAGIRPGAGVGHGGQALCRQSMGVPVLCLGVAMMAYVDPFGDRHCVSPQNLEEVVACTANLLGAVLTDALARSC